MMFKAPNIVFLAKTQNFEASILQWGQYGIRSLPHWSQLAEINNIHAPAILCWQ